MNVLVPVGCSFPVILLGQREGVEPNLFNWLNVSLNFESLKFLASLANINNSPNDLKITLQRAWNEGTRVTWPEITEKNDEIHPGNILLGNSSDSFDRWLSLGIQDILDHRLFVLCYEGGFASVSASLSKSFPIPLNWWFPAVWQKQAWDRMDFSPNNNEFKNLRQPSFDQLYKGLIAVSHKDNNNDAGKDEKDISKMAFSLEWDWVKKREEQIVKPFLDALEEQISSKTHQINGSLREITVYLVISLALESQSLVEMTAAYNLKSFRIPNWWVQVCRQTGLAVISETSYPNIWKFWRANYGKYETLLVNLFPLLVKHSLPPRPISFPLSPNYLDQIIIVAKKVCSRESLISIKRSLCSVVKAKKDDISSMLFLATGISAMTLYRIWRLSLMIK